MGIALTLGCGQSVPQSMRSGAASISACAIGTASLNGAPLADARSGPVEPSLQLLTALHERWVMAWEALKEADWARTFIHPVRGAVSLDHLASLYSWHGQHHVTQVVRLRLRNGW